jgi:hypothetical protein
MDKVAEEIFQLITDRVNEHEEGVSSLKESVAGIKAWVRQEVSRAVEDAKNELTVSMHTLTQESIHTARAKAEAAERELNDLQNLLAVKGTVKSVRLVHTEAGKVVGAIVTEGGVN